MPVSLMKRVPCLHCDLVGTGRLHTSYWQLVFVDGESDGIFSGNLCLLGVSIVDLFHGRSALPTSDCVDAR